MEYFQPVFFSKAVMFLWCRRDGLTRRAMNHPAEGAATIEPGEAHRTACDIFAPCALGAVLNRRSIPELRCRAVVGAANNQLETESDAEALTERGIIYVPDFVVNAGGVINIADELIGYHQERALDSVKRIGDTTSRILAAAAAGSKTTVEAATELAEARINSVSSTRRIASYPPPARH